MEKLKALWLERTSKAVPVIDECKSGMKPFCFAAAYCLLCVGWVLALPFALAANVLKKTGEKFKPELPKKAD